MKIFGHFQTCTTQKGRDHVVSTVTHYGLDSVGFALHSQHGSSSSAHLSILALVSNLLLLLWHYNSERVLAIAFHLERPCTCSAHFTSFIFFISFLTSPSHLDVGLPAGLPVNGFHLCILFTMLVSGTICVSKPTQSLGFNIIYYLMCGWPCIVIQCG